MKKITKISYTSFIQGVIFLTSFLHSQELFALLSDSTFTNTINPIFEFKNHHFENDTIDIYKLQNTIDSLKVSSKFREKVNDPRHTQRFHEIFHDISLHDIDSLLSTETLQHIIQLYSKYDKKNTIDLSESNIIIIKTHLQELQKLMMKEKIADLTSQYLIHSSTEYAQRTGAFYIFDPNTTDVLETLIKLNKAQEYEATIEYLKSNKKYNQIYLSNLPETSSSLLGLFLHHYFSFELSHSCNAQPIDGFLAHYNTISQQYFDENTIKHYAQEFFDIHIQELKGQILNDISLAIEDQQIDIQNEEERKGFIIQWIENHNSEIALLQQFSDKYKLGIAIKDRIGNI